MTPGNSHDPTAEWRCQKCLQIPWDYSEWDLKEMGLKIQIQHHDSFSALEQSAALGCLLCCNFRARVIHNVNRINDLKEGQCALRFTRGHMSMSYDFYVGKWSTTLNIARANISTIPAAPLRAIKRIHPTAVCRGLELTIVRHGPGNT